MELYNLNSSYDFGRWNFRISKQFTLCEISSSHGGEYDVQSCLLGYTAV
jgi:hypothetical protein